jgi:hypothetical protein
MQPVPFDAESILREMRRRVDPRPVRYTVEDLRSFVHQEMFLRVARHPALASRPLPGRTLRRWCERFRRECYRRDRRARIGRRRRAKAVGREREFDDMRKF